MKSKLILVTITAIAFAFGTMSTVSAGMQNEGARPYAVMAKNTKTDAQMSKEKKMKQMQKHQKKTGTKGKMGAVMNKKGMKKGK